MSNWPLSRTDITRPAYRSLAQGIAAAIDAGSLRPGDRLPPHRELAWQLNLSVQTVSRAYEELIRADLISGEVGRGSFIRSGPRDTVEVPWYRPVSGHSPIDLSMMTPVALPRIAEAWAESMARLATSLSDPAIYSFRPHQTMRAYAGMAASWLARCGLVVPSQRILITNGTTPAMFTALLSIAKAGDEIATESSTCHTLMPTAKSLQLKLRGIPCDDRGMIPEALRDAARASAGRMRGVFLLPSGAGPFARIMDRQRREALAEVTASAGLALLENDALGPTAPRRPPPVSSFVPDCGFYFTGLSKSLSPGLRLGFLVMPESQAERVKNRHLSVSWMATPMIAEIARDWIETGTADALLEAQRNELVARNRLAQRILGGRSEGFPQGLHRWLPLPSGCDERKLVDQMLAHDVAIAPGAGFAVSDSPPALRIALGGAQFRDLEQGLQIVASLLPPADQAA